MKFVVDTNIIFSLFKSKSYITELLNELNLELFSPKDLLNELNKYSETICSKAQISTKEFKFKLSLLPELIEFKSPSEDYRLEANKIISHKTDVPFLALAMELNIPIWSNDKHFKEQDKVKIFTTEELSSFINEKLK
mgnify:CR=1 FL=1